MATSRTRNETVLVNQNRDNPGITQRVKRFTITYNSNRENGQIVKRESPLLMYLDQYTRWKPSGNMDVVNEQFAVNVQNWNHTAVASYSRAYGDFKRKASMPSAEVLLNVVEGRKSLEMIAARAFQLRNLASSLRRGRLGDAWAYMSANPDSSLIAMKNGRRRDSRFVSGKARESSMDEARRWRQLVKDVSSLLLEFRYGWSPLMQDIKGAIEVLSKPIPDTALRSSKGQSYSYTTGAGYLVHGSERVTIKGRIRVSNPNLDLANRLGLINPASVAWEAVPFSFVVDWFLPVGNFLQGFTDFVGLELIEGSITGRATATALHIPGYRYVGNTNQYVWDTDARSGHAVKMVRTVTSSLPRPPLTLGRGLTPGRAINAVALLAQTLNPRKGASIRSE